MRIAARTALALVAVFASTAALGQTFPNHPVKLISPFPPGGGSDVVARILAPKLLEATGQQFVVENRTGAAGNVGADYVAKSPPDGYTLLVANNTVVTNPAVAKSPFDVVKDFTPVALIGSTAVALAVHPDFPARSVDELVKLARENPGKYSYSSCGNGTAMHLAGELFMRETGTKMVHVPYNAPGTATTNLMAGDIQLMFQLIPGIVGQVKGGKVRPIAVMAPTRSPALPDVPTTAEAGQPKLLSSTWFALLAPKGTPGAIVDRVNADVNEILKDPAVRKRLSDMGATPLGGTPKQLADHLASETVKWGNVVRDAKIQIQ